MTEWLDQVDRFPMWEDADKLVELLFAHGSIIRGRLWLEDVGPGPDETPIWRVVPEDAPMFPDEGAGVSFWDAERFRFLS